MAHQHRSSRADGDGARSEQGGVHLKGVQDANITEKEFHFRTLRVLTDTPCQFQRPVTCAVAVSTLPPWRSRARTLAKCYNFSMRERRVGARCETESRRGSPGGSEGDSGERQGLERGFERKRRLEMKIIGGLNLCCFGRIVVAGRTSVT